MRSFHFSLAGSLIMLILLAGCPSRPRLPDDPGLTNEDFGLGITLGMPAETAATAAEDATGCEVSVVSREELNKHAPYDSTENVHDRVLVIHTEGLGFAENTNAAGEVDAVDDIRCYLADPGESVVKLGGTEAALLTEDHAVERYGQPVQRTETGDSETHLTYYFAIDQQPKQMIELVLSFHHGGYCFALAASLQPHID